MMPNIKISRNFSQHTKRISSKVSMASIRHPYLLFFTLLFFLCSLADSFAPKALKVALVNNRHVTKMASCMDTEAHPSTLPGDPSLNLVTNVDLGDNKLDFMKGAINI